MATLLVNTNRVISEVSPETTATGVERLLVNAGLTDVRKYAPIVNSGWDDDYNCMKIARASDLYGAIMGLAITPMTALSVMLCKYITSGVISFNPATLVAGDTLYTGEPWEVGDTLYATTVGTIVNRNAALETDDFGVIGQPIGNVGRYTTTAAEINIMIAVSSSFMATEPGFRKKKIVVDGGTDTLVMFSRPLPMLPHVTAEVIDEEGTTIGVSTSNITKSGFTLSVMAGGTGVHSCIYTAMVEV